MDLTKVLAQLHAELADLDAAILSLERLQREGRRRGRPPKLLAGIRRTGRPGNRQAEAKEGESSSGAGAKA
jgi:hypothetical protein